MIESVANTNMIPHLHLLRDAIAAESLKATNHVIGGLPSWVTWWESNPLWLVTLSDLFDF